ncbi:hypothetical protein FQA39_LY12877 [Lamprigera yunnana]|nr:hypothetical protein FQA39_LY12877 [Lamprigera yunnana]
MIHQDIRNAVRHLIKEYKENNYAGNDLILALKLLEPNNYAGFSQKAFAIINDPVQKDVSIGEKTIDDAFSTLKKYELDKIDMEVVESCVENKVELVITRHPFIFVDLDIEKKNPSKREIIKILEKHNINVFSIHTNYDASLLSKHNHYVSTSEINETFRYSILYKEDLPDAQAFLNGVLASGPTLFATFIFNIVQGLTINYLYPKNQIYTYFISTIKPDEVEEFLFNAGYQNNGLHLIY